MAEGAARKRPVSCQAQPARCEFDQHLFRAAADHHHFHLPIHAFGASAAHVAASAKNLDGCIGTISQRAARVIPEQRDLACDIVAAMMRCGSPACGHCDPSSAAGIDVGKGESFVALIITFRLTQRTSRLVPRRAR